MYQRPLEAHGVMKLCACAFVHMCVQCNIMIMITTDMSQIKKTAVEKNDLLFYRKQDRER